MLPVTYYTRGSGSNFVKSFTSEPFHPATRPRFACAKLPVHRAGRRATAATMSGDSSLELMDAYQESPDQNSLAELAASKDVLAGEEDMEVRPRHLPAVPLPARS